MTHLVPPEGLTEEERQAYFDRVRRFWAGEDMEPGPNEQPIIETPVGENKVVASIRNLLLSLSIRKNIKQ